MPKLPKTITSALVSGGGLASGINADNYAEYGRLRVTANGGTGFLVALRNGEKHGVKYTQSIKQYGAWLAFFKRARIPHQRMERSEFYTVPAEWPHQFTTDSTITEDHEAGGEFERRWFDSINSAPKGLRPSVAAVAPRKLPFM